MKRIVYKIVLILLVFVFAAGVPASGVSFAVENTRGGTGAGGGVHKDTSWFDSENPKNEYTLYSEEELIGFASLVNEEQRDKWKENRFETFENVKIRLGRDIRLSQKWVPVGNGDSRCFKGIFDGDGHTISGLKIRSNNLQVGFFGCLSGEVCNLTLKGRTESLNGPCGSFAGVLYAGGSIRDCKSEAETKGLAETGGIVGYNEDGTVLRCINNRNVSGTRNVGGIAGENWGTVKKCGNNGSVKSSVRGSTSFGTGGIAGRTLNPDGPVTKCFNTGNIQSHTEATGGIAGYSNAYGTEISNCYNTGSIAVYNEKLSHRAVKAYAGGIVGIAGRRGVVIKNCYNAGSINNSDWSGGIIGEYDQDLIEETNDKPNDEKYIVNNYYISTDGGKGIGQYHVGDGEYKPKDISHGTKKMSSFSLVNMASNLGSAYKYNSYGTGLAAGYPVLKWQDASSVDSGDSGKDKLPQNAGINERILREGTPDEAVTVRLFNPRQHIAGKALKKEKNSQEYIKKCRKPGN